MSHPQDLGASLEGLLRGKRSATLQPSLDEAYRSPSDSGEELDELNLLDENETGAERKHGLWQRRGKKHAYEELTASKRTRRPRLRSIGRRLRTRGWKICLIVTVLLLGGLTTLLVSGGYLVYRNAPHDGVCFLED